MKTIIDNWLDPALAEFLEINLLYERAHWFGHKSIDKELIVPTGDSRTIDNSFYSHILDNNEPINKYLFYKLRKTFKKPIKLLRMYFNVQWKGMEGTYHKDEGDITCIYMVTETREKGDGDFQIKGEGRTRFVQNRLICFDANKEHRGLAPNNGVRITLAFKTTLEK